MLQLVFARSDRAAATAVVLASIGTRLLQNAIKCGNIHRRSNLLYTATSHHIMKSESKAVGGGSHTGGII